MVSASGISSVLLVIFALGVVMLQINKKEHQAVENARVATPMIGMTTMHQGPWPFCVKNKMQGDACCQKILSHTKDISTENCVVIHEEEETNDITAIGFVPTRVRVFVDSDGIVTKIPRRG
mmetsp:Transcript_11235/g.16028  ORF Transcript_11235/g.16028 Transcript_11235/m.16028 type:complete len:121 (+) Transcript_11235:123-485(+)|eukprot:CAMPEP_0202449880 /NCGR_PEP_ID=MMETSP1360-20130828/8555_1 /ASSEMBLY_ACC=CAM_ASM_000848 /TAXON_ID=515479 /ORGANISM="Licmophora paradoxa, Strain CCMP2313" /LENGTH=120 /DNA_ID=CAMNT_0049067943 /DNA_START=94 /DNA_END=456 /DNA_ORIENTATION=-